jgi:plasmid stabilization system protein ParE
VPVTGTGRRYTLTETAERDFREARRWSRSHWSPELTQQYFAALHAGAEDTVKNYRSLAQKDHLTGTCELAIRAVREHYIVYVPIGIRSIVIVALIRQTRDVPVILKANSFVIERQLHEIADSLKRGAIRNLPE